MRRPAPPQRTHFAHPPRLTLTGLQRPKGKLTTLPHHGCPLLQAAIAYARGWIKTLPKGKFKDLVIAVLSSWERRVLTQDAAGGVVSVRLQTLRKDGDKSGTFDW